MNRHSHMSVSQRRHFPLYSHIQGGYSAYFLFELYNEFCSPGSNQDDWHLSGGMLMVRLNWIAGFSIALLHRKRTASTTTKRTSRSKVLQMRGAQVPRKKTIMSA